MTTLNRPTPRPEPTDPRPPTEADGAEPAAELEPEAGLEPDATTSYGLDGFTPLPANRAGGRDPHDTIDLEGLAEQVYLLLLREAYIERERQSPR